MEYSLPSSVQQIPGYESLHDIQPLINPNYYNETSVITETEYFADGSVKTNTQKQNSDYTGALIQQGGTLMQQTPFGGMDQNPTMMAQPQFIDPNQYAMYIQQYYASMGYQPHFMQQTPTGYPAYGDPNQDQMPPNQNNE